VPMLDPTPADVADVYDVVGLLDGTAHDAAFALYDGGTLSATWPVRSPHRR